MSSITLYSRLLAFLPGRPVGWMCPWISRQAKRASRCTISRNAERSEGHQLMRVVSFGRLVREPDGPERIDLAWFVGYVGAQTGRTTPRWNMLTGLERPDAGAFLA